MVVVVVVVVVVLLLLLLPPHRSSRNCSSSTHLCDWLPVERWRLLPALCRLYCGKRAPVDLRCRLYHKRLPMDLPALFCLCHKRLPVDLL